MTKKELIKVANDQHWEIKEKGKNIAVNYHPTLWAWFLVTDKNIQFSYIQNTEKKIEIKDPQIGLSLIWRLDLYLKDIKEIKNDSKDKED
jgi:uncharacterized protein YijF (DUF1287 family)